jgi:nucleotide-binding universal stress UspA family protein
VYVTPAVEPVASLGAGFDYAATEQGWQEVAMELKDEAMQRARDLGVPLSFVRELGDAAHALTRVARSAAADLVVVGRSEKLLHHLAGSLGRRLVSRRDAPVTVVVP